MMTIQPVCIRHIDHRSFNSQSRQAFVSTVIIPYSLSSTKWMKAPGYKIIYKFAFRHLHLFSSLMILFAKLLNLLFHLTCCCNLHPAFGYNQ